MPRTHVISLDEYIKALGASSQRSRSALLATVIASVLVFAALWNSLHFSWVMQRLDAARDARRVLAAQPSIPTDALRQHLQWPTPRLQRAMALIDLREARTAEELATEVAALERLRDEKLRFVAVPFFGVGFDVNDLGLIGGLSLAILLFIFFYCLRREHANLQVAFDEARARGQLPETYTLLAMSQVFTLPPGAADDKDASVWRPFAKVLYCLPLVLQAGVLVNDAFTFHVGATVSLFSATLTLSCGLTLLFLILLLTVVSMRLAQRIDALWASVHAQITR